MELPTALIEGWQKSFCFTGRATRISYWMFQIATSILIIGIGIAAGISESRLMMSLIVIYVVANTFPGIAISVRRLRDAGKKWQWIFVSCIPFIGFIWFLTLMCLPSKPNTTTSR